LKHKSKFTGKGESIENTILSQRLSKLKILFHWEIIANEILLCLRSNKKFDNDVYLQEPIGVDKEGNQHGLQSE